MFDVAAHQDMNLRRALGQSAYRKLEGMAMSKGLFGWSLPPGVSTLPGDEEEGPCEVCGEFVDNCICPECPVCGCAGDPCCYKRRGGTWCPSAQHHGLERTEEQRFSYAMATREWEDEARARAAFEAALESSWDAWDAD